MFGQVYQLRFEQASELFHAAAIEVDPRQGVVENVKRRVLNRLLWILRDLEVKAR